MDTLTLLKNHWQSKHFEHLQYCFRYCSFYFEDHLDYQGVKNGGLCIDGKTYMPEDIVKILAAYYEDKTSDYQSAVGDIFYLFFTDLVDDDVDILSVLEDDAEVA